MKDITEILQTPIKGAVLSQGDDGISMQVQGPRKTVLRIVASWGDGWDHVSVSLSSRTPRWEEMNFIKDLFFNNDETVMQLHPKKSEYINVHEFVLHMWRPHDAEILTPPLYMV